MGDSKTAVEIINSIRSGSNALPQPPLPGHGDPYLPEDDMPTCGEDFTWRVCDNCGDDHKIGSTCDRWECPRCYKRAVLHAAESVTSKLAHYRDKYAKGSELRFHRVVMVPPPDEDFETVADPLDKLYEVAGDLLEAGGGHHGGVRIPHPYRHADEADPTAATDRELALVGGKEDDDQGIWKHTLPDWNDGHTPDWSETRAKLEHEPHIHAYMVSESFWLPTEEIYEETGWVIKRLEPYEHNKVSCYGVEDLARSVMYALSHCGDYANTPHYRFFGALSNEPASDAQKARMSDICRDHAEHILGLSTSSVTCKRDVSGDAESDSPTPIDDGNDGSFNGGGGGGESSSDNNVVAMDDSNDYLPCGGRLRRLKYVPDLLEEHDEDWSEATKQRLRELYQDVIGPPG